MDGRADDPEHGIEVGPAVQRVGERATEGVRGSGRWGGVTGPDAGEWAKVSSDIDPF